MFEEIWPVCTYHIEMTRAYVGGISKAEKSTEEIAPVPALCHWGRQLGD